MDAVSDSALQRLRTRVKFCGLVRPEDIRIAARLGIDAIGFVFYERSSRFLSRELALALRPHVPSWVSVVGLFVNAPPKTVQEHSAWLGLDSIQFHGDESLDTIEASLRPGQPYWRAVRMQSADDLLKSRVAFSNAECFLLDAYSAGFGGSGKRFDWSWVSSTSASDVIMSGGLDAESVVDAIESVAPLGVDVSSGIQAADPRQKDARKMEAFMAAVADADARPRVRNC